MNFNELLGVAASKQQEVMKKLKVNRYNLDLPAPKREEKTKPKSETVQRLIQEKEREKREKEEKKREEQERLEKEERKRNSFKIPKKKLDLSEDKQKLIDSLFDDTGGDSPSPPPPSDERDHSKLSTSSHPTKSSSSDKKSSTSSSHKSSSQSKESSSKTSSSSSSHSSSSHSKESSSNRSSSSHKSSSHSKDSDKRHSGSSSHSKHSSSSGAQSSGSSKEKNHSSSSSSSHKPRTNHDRDESKKSSSSSSLSSSKHVNGKSSSSSQNKDKSSSSQSKDKSSSSQSKENSSSNITAKTNGALSTSDKSKPSSECPIALNKNHLNPILERHTDTSLVSEKAKILARLQAIKERTLAKFAKENEGKGKRVRGSGQTSHRRSKQEELSEKAKSAEIVKDDGSSDEEGGVDQVSALDIMLQERNAKLEKEKIQRMAKKAWERATKGSSGESDNDTKSVSKVKKIRNRNKIGSSSISIKPSHKSFKERKGDKPSHSIRQEEMKPKKPVVVRHAGNRAPPPMDFKAIMAIAQQKTKEPAKPAGPVVAPKKKKKEEERRPMTQEEKDRIARKNSKEYQDWLKFGGKPPADSSRRHSISEDSEDGDDTVRHKNGKNVSQGSSSHKELHHSAPKSVQSSASLSNHKSVMKGKSSSNQLSRPNHKIPVNENILMCGPGEDDDDSDVGTAVSNQQNLNPFDRIVSQVHKKRPSSQFSGKSCKRMRLDSEEEEDDSDLDGFIDDGDDGEMDYSKEIQNIFKYDKRKYKDEDDDLSNMEANFATVMAEEKRSAKLGLQEDLEDMRQEQEELKRKAALKKKMMKRSK